MPKKVARQWSTLESGPLATRKKSEFRAIAPKSREPVVHFQEWSTGYLGKGRNLGFCPEMTRASGPLAT